MENLEKKSLKIDFSNRKYSGIYNKIKELMINYIYPLIFFINQIQPDNIQLDCLIIIIDFLQLLSYPFQLKVKNIFNFSVY